MTRAPAQGPLAAFVARGSWPLLLPLFSAPLLTAVLGKGVRVIAGLPHGRLLPPGEVAVQLVVAYTLAALARRPVPFLLSQASAVLACHAAQALRVSATGGPIRPLDVLAAPELFRVLDLRWAGVLAAPFLLVAALVAGNLAFRRGAAAAAAAGAALLAGALAFRPGLAAAVADGGLPHVPWGPTENMLRQGPAGYLLGETARLRLERREPPTLDEVRAALASSPATREPRAEGKPPSSRRDVVLILLESFWDPSLLRAAGLDRDPVDPRLRALWRSGGDSTALSPEFGGATANCEMEVLCGIPTRLVLPGIAFASGFSNDLPCLPRLLAREGFTPEAFHPNDADFWGRDRAYPRIGLARFHSAGEFELDDLDGERLSDESLFRQVRRLARPPTRGAPRLTYVLTLTGHWPYPLGERRRADAVFAASAPPEVGAYATSILHTSRALASYIEQVLADSPDALVVALGDHLPVLGESLDVYRDSGLFDAAGAVAAPAAFRAVSAVPLLVVDGRRGPVRVGTISHFELPAFVLERLGLPVPPWMAALLPPPGWHVRTRDQGLLVLSPDGASRVCHSKDEAPECGVAFRWLERASVVARDLVDGRQHALSLLPDEPAAPRSPIAPPVADNGDGGTDAISRPGGPGWANSKALALAGITRETKDPLNGNIVRDPKTGEPTGALKEAAGSLVEELIPEPTPERHDTIDASYAGFAEKERGSIAVGKRADLVVLSRDLLSGPPEEILKTRALLTLFGGKAAWRDPAF